MVQVNLLPGGYQKRRRHNRRFRAVALVGCLLLAVELIVGIVVHARAERTRTLYAAADAARQNSTSTKKELEEPRHEAERLAREVYLAERLRTKHRWSRLLSTLGQVTPGRILITSVNTDPERWTANMLTAPMMTSDANKDQKREILHGIKLSGQAIDHQDLAAFMAAIHSTRSFSSLDLKQARREKLAEQESIVFELECHW